MHWFLDPIQKHYADFQGRVGRQEFWMFILFSFGLNVVLSILGIDVIGTIISLALLAPSLAIGARRLHDTGRSGWWQLLGLIPVIGWIVLIIWCAEETKPVDNQFGAPAKPKVMPGNNAVGASAAAATTTETASGDVVASTSHTKDTTDAHSTEFHSDTTSDSGAHGDSGSSTD